MQKEIIIKIIKAIIANIGETTSADMELNSSPCISRSGENTIQLAETFRAEDVRVITFVNGQEEDEDDIIYEDLSKSVLEEILNELENYEVTFNKTMDK